MRTFLVLGALAIVAADLHKQGECVLDGAEAANELLDASIYIWAAVDRCGKEEGEKVKCMIDVSSAVESINGMINVILKAMKHCGKLNTINSGCGMASSKLTEAAAGLVASSGDIVQKCPNDAHVAHVAQHWAHANAAMCVVDLKSSMKSFMHAVTAMTKMKTTCEDGGDDCTNNALTLVGALAGLGSYLTGAVGHCGHHAEVAECGEAITGLIHKLVKISKAGNIMSVQCVVPVKEVVKAEPGVVVEIPVEVQLPRLYEAKGSKKGANSSSLILAAFLPITAIVSFVGGRLYARSREQAREVGVNEEELE